MDSNSSWQNEKNYAGKEISESSQQIYLLAVAQPDGVESEGEILKVISPFAQNVSHQQHIILPVNQLIPSLKTDDEAVKDKCLGFAAATFDASQSANDCTQSPSSLRKYVTEKTLPRPGTLHLESQTNEFNLNEPSSVTPLENTAPDNFLCKEPASVDNEYESNFDRVNQVIPDVPLTPRAKLTLPTKYLCFQNVSSRKDLIGVFASQEIGERTRFGPVVGVERAGVSRQQPCSGLQFLVEKPDASFAALSLDNEDLCNWTRYVRVALSAEQQNVVLNQSNQELHFITTKTIRVGQELRVWYSSDYASKRDLPLLAKGRDRWKCASCGFVSLKSKPMNSHLFLHRYKKRESAKIDGELTDIGTNPNKNKTTIVDSDDISSRQIGCDRCGQDFISSTRLNLHMLSHSPADVESKLASNPLFDGEEAQVLLSEETTAATCDICDKSFKSPHAYSLHYRTHTEEVTFVCPICRQLFKRMNDMKSHVATHKRNGTFHCPHCEKSSQTYKQMRKHIRLKHAGHRFNCDVCWKTFTTKDYLQKHLLSHSDEKQFLCSDCGKQFKRKDKLVKHMKDGHSVSVQLLSKELHLRKNVEFDKVQSNYKCYECRLAFKRRGVLVNHILSRHPGTRLESVPALSQPIVKTTKEFFCRYCDKVYKSSTKRKEHILKFHPGMDLPPSKRGLHKDVFTQLVSETNTEPHVCEYCSKQYVSRSKLSQHQRKAHLYLLPKHLRVPGYGSSLQPKTLTQAAEKSTTEENNMDMVCVEGDNVEGLSSTRDDLVEGAETEDIYLSDGGIIVDGPTLKKFLKSGDSANVECLLDSGLEHLLAQSRPDQYFKILTRGGVTLAQPVELWDPLNLPDAMHTASLSNPNSN